MLSDSYQSFANLLSSAVRDGLPSQLPHSASISVEFVSAFMGPGVLSAIVALCPLRCFRTTDRACFKDTLHLLRISLCLEVFSWLLYFVNVPLLS